MTTRTYQEIYLSKAQAALGDAFDYAINTYHIPGSDFVKLFTASSVSRRMENGEPSLLAGKSGIEIATDVVLETTGKQPETEPQEHFRRSREYWIRWAVCYYQWFSARSYSDIFNDSPTKIWRICTIRFTKRTSRNLWTSPMRRYARISKIPT